MTDKTEKSEKAAPKASDEPLVPEPHQILRAERREADLAEAAEG